ncbi:alpha-1,2-mannosidase [Coccidioides immitis RS]|uniref:Alpha-1,2-mannosidase n=1 Tax=Coccidioides immitis (strain RS) TaxID=246410 RepID=A0A0E1RV06_COCIM|nr:alpha-1,2-mannosidase [Coccidioides immitis RS]EAS27511.2 alpha-1,2-mannosidase [Coccidioides immitis RS]
MMLSRKHIQALILLNSLFIHPTIAVPPDLDPLSFVDQLIGTVNGGNVFAGATLPYGMAKAVADVDGQKTAGFSTDGSKVTGFSHMHDSGTGGNPSLGNFPLFPQQCSGDDINNCKFPKEIRAIHYAQDSVKTSPGYFALNLVNGIEAEMTVTEHAALYSFTFPELKQDESPVVLLDLTDLNDSRQNASVSIDDSGRIKANGTFLPSFGSGSFVSHVCVDFAGADILDTGIFIDNRAGTYPKSLFVTRGINLYYIQAGTFVRFRASNSTKVSARVGVSFISADQACQNAMNEIPGSQWDFHGLETRAENTWRSKLNGIRVNPGGAGEDLQRTFWSAIYRTMISPQDYSGENPLWESEEPYFDSFYCMWDSFRSQLPLLAIFDPGALARMIRSLLDTYKYEGWLPDCRMSLSKGFTQGGSSADVVITDAYLKNVSEGIDWDLAYEAVVKDAEKEPADWSNQGRGGMVSWKSLNYIPALDFDYLGFGTNSRSISRTLEYSYNDYCIATLSKSLGKSEQDYEKYMKSSDNWRNLFKHDQSSFINGEDTGFVGFLQPKYLNGTWGYQDPILCSSLDEFCSLTSNRQETFEASIWDYQFFVPHNIPALIRLFGGVDNFIKRLDFLHNAGILDIGNEPSFLNTFLYHYARRPGLSAKRVHSYIPSRFNSSRSGLPGNDDSGAMGGFTVFTMMGLFPNPGQNIYFIMPPSFESISITHPLTNKTSTVRNINFDPAYKNIYIQNATLNGEPYSRNWIGHEFFLEGMTLELTLGEVESEWGTKPGDVPPSAGVETMTFSGQPNNVEAIV